VQVITGEIVLNESSLIVAGTTLEGSALVADTDEFSVVEEEAQLAVVGASYNSFVARRKPQHWTVDETKLFYEALRQVGTDFGTMESYFNKKRTRKQLKRKFQIETTKNPQLIDNALNVECMKEIGTS
jgi:transcription factor TFIIIB component B''